MVAQQPGEQGWKKMWQWLDSGSIGLVGICEEKECQCAASHLEHKVLQHSSVNLPMPPCLHLPVTPLYLPVHTRLCDTLHLGHSGLLSYAYPSITRPLPCYEEFIYQHLITCPLALLCTCRWTAKGMLLQSSARPGPADYEPKPDPPKPKHKGNASVSGEESCTLPPPAFFTPSHGPHPALCTSSDMLHAAL